MVGARDVQEYNVRDVTWMIDKCGEIVAIGFRSHMSAHAQGFGTLILEIIMLPLIA